MNCNCEDHHHDHANAPGDESVALLRYMIHHNQHHADELYELAGKLSGEARELVHAAVIQYETGTGKLEEALKLLEKED